MSSADTVAAIEGKQSAANNTTAIAGGRSPFCSGPFALLLPVDRLE